MANFNQQPMTEQQLYRVAPSIFAEEKHTSRSDRFAYFSTIEILRALAAEGFKPYSAYQASARTADKTGFTRHMIKLRHELQKDLIKVGDEINEITLVNAHDGTSTLQLNQGILRVACLNGLMVGQSMQEIRVPHRTLTTSDVIEGAYTILNEQEIVNTKKEEMKELTLDSNEQLVLAQSAMSLRWEPEDWRPNVKDIIVPKRTADQRNDLWTTFNRIQENLIRGGMEKTVNRPKPDSRGKVRAVTGIADTVKINRQLWDLAEGMRNLKLGIDPNAWMEDLL